MNKNMSSADRIIRLIISAIMVTLYFTNVVGGTAGIILLVLSGVFTLTSIINFCPLYAVFGISTCSVKKQQKNAQLLTTKDPGDAQRKALVLYFVLSKVMQIWVTVAGSKHILKIYSKSGGLLFLQLKAMASLMQA